MATSAPTPGCVPVIGATGDLGLAHPEAARVVEQLTPLLISVNSRHETHAGLRLTGPPDGDHWSDA